MKNNRYEDRQDMIFDEDDNHDDFVFLFFVIWITFLKSSNFHWDPFNQKLWSFLIWSKISRFFKVSYEIIRNHLKKCLWQLWCVIYKTKIRSKTDSWHRITVYFLSKNNNQGKNIDEWLEKSWWRSIRSLIH